MSTKKLPKILTLPNSILRQKSVEVEKFDQELKQLANNLTELLKLQKDPVGLGLSASQIGVLKRVFVVRAPTKIRPFINPVITRFSKKRVRFIAISPAKNSKVITWAWSPELSNMKSITLMAFYLLITFMPKMVGFIN